MKTPAKKEHIRVIRFLSTKNPGKEEPQSPTKEDHTTSDPKGQRNNGPINLIHNPRTPSTTQPRHQSPPNKDRLPTNNSNTKEGTRETRTASNKDTPKAKPRTKANP